MAAPLFRTWNTTPTHSLQVELMSAASQRSTVPLTATLLLLWAAGTLIWWGLAFPPWVQAPAPWLVRVQQICFGTDQAGQPSAFGWGALVAGPLGLLLSMLTGWSAELHQGLRRLARSGAGRAMLAALVLVLGTQAVWVGIRVAGSTLPADAGAVSGPEEPLPPDYPRLDRPVPDFRLVDAAGVVRTPRSYRGRLVLLTFAYGHCTTVCPLTLSTVRNAADYLAALNPAIVVITLDAWRDTPSTLQSLMTRWALPPSASVLSGHPATVGRALDAFNVVSQRNEKTGDIDHVALVYVIDPQGRIAYALASPTAAWVVEAARRAACTGAAGPGCGR